MSAVPYEDDGAEQWDDHDEETLALPGRPRRRYLNPLSLLLVALVTCAAGFYAGIRVEKGQLSSSSTASRGFTLPALAGSGTGAASRGAAGAAGGTRSAASARGFAGGGAGFAGGSASIGTITSVNGNTIYVASIGGNTVKVTLSSATKITKSLGVSKHSLRPGDSVVIRGATNSSGKVSATSISDTGASTTGTGGAGGTGGGSGASGGSSGNAAVNSLFGSGSGN
jgi:hypothetical protein